MALSTKTETPADKKTKIAELRKKHEPLFEKEGVGDDAKFIPKMAYNPYSGAEKVISFFPSEISGGVDIYTEFVSREYESEDPERRLWKWVYNEHYATEYEQTEPHPVSGHSRYLVPIEELILVSDLHQAVEEAIEPLEDLPDPNDDAPMDAMTIRDYAAIHQWKPVSKKKWLNKLIKSSK